MGWWTIYKNDANSLLCSINERTTRFAAIFLCAETDCRWVWLLFSFPLFCYLCFFCYYCFNLDAFLRPLSFRYQPQRPCTSCESMGWVWRTTVHAWHPFLTDIFNITSFGGGPHAGIGKSTYNLQLHGRHHTWRRGTYVIRTAILCREYPNIRHERRARPLPSLLWDSSEVTTRIHGLQLLHLIIG